MSGGGLFWGNIFSGDVFLELFRLSSLGPYWSHWTFVFSLNHIALENRNLAVITQHCFHFLFYLLWAIMINYWIPMLCWDIIKNISLVFSIISNVINCKTASFHWQIFFTQRQDNLGGIFVYLSIHLFAYSTSFIYLLLHTLIMECHLFLYFLICLFICVGERGKAADNFSRRKHLPWYKSSFCFNRKAFWWGLSPTCTTTALCQTDIHL